MASGDLTRRAGKDENDLLRRIDALEEEVRQLKANQANNNPIPALSQTYTITNGTIDRTYDANASSTAELADLIFTILTDLGAPITS